MKNLPTGGNATDTLEIFALCYEYAFTYCFFKLLDAELLILDVKEGERTGFKNGLSFK